ncbi:hypothetical protein ABGV42_01225 [Paenibacillus pabuli]|uniref:hypothetical protein n=1 Tax=Paenibacillus pabuli TaxID=1472 RepID=UPI003242318E
MITVAIKSGTSGHYDPEGNDLIIAQFKYKTIPQIGHTLHINLRARDEFNKLYLLTGEKLDKYYQVTGVHNYFYESGVAYEVYQEVTVYVVEI